MLKSFFFLFGFVMPLVSFAADGNWFHNNSEFLAYQTQRQAMANDPSTKINTDGKRFDVTLGNRIPVYSWGEGENWSIGADGGMLASLSRYQSEGKLTFATETFDGFFGLYIARMLNEWLFMVRTAHLSAHLVDNAPDVFTNTTLYNAFWTEGLAGYFFREPKKATSWNIYLQGSLGVYTTSLPEKSGPRTALGLTYNHHLGGADSLEAIVSGDLLHTGIKGQKTHTATFVGIGRSGAAVDTSMRPFRVGVTFFRGSDHRNQYYTRTDHLTAFTVHTDF